MKFTASALAAALAATTVATQSPTSVEAWSTNIMGSPFCAGSSPMMLSSPAVDMLRRQQAMVNRAYQLERQQRLTHNKRQQEGSSSSSSSKSSSRTDMTNTVSPRYEITEEGHQIQIAVDVPGVKMEDIDVTLEDNILTIRGQRSVSSSSKTTTTASSLLSSSNSSNKFAQSFALNDPTIDVDKFTASLENGVLLVVAPKDMKRIEDNIRKIPITLGATSPSSDVTDTSTTTVAAAATIADPPIMDDDFVVMDEDDTPDVVETEVASSSRPVADESLSKEEKEPIEIESKLNNNNKKDHASGEDDVDEAPNEEEEDYRSGYTPGDNNKE